jgi:hypothetical protein
MQTDRDLKESTVTLFKLKQYTPSDIRALEDAEIEMASGAKFQTYDFGVLGTLWLGEGCAAWSMSTTDEQGFFSTQTEGYCPPN